MGYQLTMRFISGAINRWRANQHIGYLKQMGFDILQVETQVQPQLPNERGTAGGAIPKHG